MHANRMNVSVALCTYNNTEFLSEQLKSILNQTVNLSEIVICDDASTDGTWQLILAWQQKYPEIIKAIRNNSNLGYTKNFEKAISLCTGDIIFLSDQDDVWYEYKVEKVLDVFLSNPECKMVVSDAAITDVKLNRCNTTLLSGRGILKYNTANSFHQKYDRSFFYGCTMAIRGSLREYILPIPKSWGHDNWIGFIAGIISHIQIISEPLMLYRNHEGGAGDNAKLEKWGGGILCRLSPATDDKYEQDWKSWNDMYNHLAVLNNKVNTLVRDEALREVGARCKVASYRIELLKARYVVGIGKSVRLLMDGSYGEYLSGWRSFIKDVTQITLNRGTGRYRA